MPIIQSIRENRLVPVKSYRVSGSDGKNYRQPRNFQNLLMVSAKSRLADGRLQKLRGGGTRFSEKVKSYLTAQFDVDTQTGRKPDLSEVATDMTTTRNTVVQERSRDEWLTKGQVQSFFSRPSAISRKKRADQNREC